MKNLKSFFVLFLVLTFIASCTPQALEEEIQLENEQIQSTNDEDTSEVDNEKDG